MSQQNVEVVRGGFEAWNAGDMDAYREVYDPNVVMRTAGEWPESGPFVGREAVMRWVEQLRETWSSDELEPIDVIDAGDRVVVRQVWKAVGHGPDSSIDFTAVNTLRAGRIVLVDLFWDHAEALEAVGLSE